MKDKVVKAHAVERNARHRGIHVHYNGLIHRDQSIPMVSWSISHAQTSDGFVVWKAHAHDNPAFEPRWSQHFPEFGGSFVQSDSIENLLAVLGVAHLVDPEPFKALDPTGVSQHRLATHRREPTFRTAPSAPASSKEAVAQDFSEEQILQALTALGQDPTVDRLERVKARLAGNLTPHLVPGLTRDVLLASRFHTVIFRDRSSGDKVDVPVEKALDFAGQQRASHEVHGVLGDGESPFAYAKAWYSAETGEPVAIGAGAYGNLTIVQSTRHDVAGRVLAGAERATTVPTVEVGTGLDM